MSGKDVFQHQSITGIVIHGKKEARQLGFPTANIRCSPELYNRIPEGIYGSLCWVLGQHHSSISYVRDSLIEVHLIDKDMNLYGQQIIVSLTKFIREPIPYTTAEAMRLQIKKDIREIIEN